MIPRRLLRRFSVADLREAIRQRSQLGKVEALEAKREALLKQVAKVDRKLAKLHGNGSVPISKPGRKPGRRKGWKLSKATREKMRQAALRRYAGKGKPESSAAERKKRKPLSPETKAKMAEAARKRWAKIKGTAQAQ